MSGAGAGRGLLYAGSRALCPLSHLFLGPCPALPTHPPPPPTRTHTHRGRKNRGLDRNHGLGLNSVTTALRGQIPSDPRSPPL